MSQFVLDASVTLAWVLEENTSTQQFFSSETVRKAVVPAPWLFETANGVVEAERRGRLTEQQTVSWLAELAQTAQIIELDPYEAASLTKVAAVARKYRISAYDATYLELAMRRGRVLATLERRLRAAVEAGVKVLP